MRADRYAVVVGGVNMDVCGIPHAPPVPRDSNPGRVRLSLGGVGRNIAHNMALLGLPTALVTALGGDPFAGKIRESCRELGIDLSHSLSLPGEATSTYLVLTDHTGEMELAVSDMEIYRHLTPEYIAGQMDFLNAADLVVVDANLPGETLAYLAVHCTAPIFADPVSTAKAEKLRPILGRLHTLKPNRLEASLLSGVDIVDEKSLGWAVERLLDTGLERLFLSTGPDGAVCAHRGGMTALPAFPGPMKNATGCGDAFMAALAWGWWEGLDLADTGRAGLAAAAIALAGEETINPALSAQSVRKLANL